MYSCLFILKDLNRHPTERWWNRRFVFIGLAPLCCGSAHEIQRNQAFSGILWGNILGFTTPSIWRVIISHYKLSSSEWHVCVHVCLRLYTLCPCLSLCVLIGCLSSSSRKSTPPEEVINFKGPCVSVRVCVCVSERATEALGCPKNGMHAG